MRRDRSILLLVSLAILIPGTWGVSLVDRDEGWYAQVAREMVESGDWLVPRYLGDIWLHKPPLLYWLVSASWSVFGIGEASARLVSVLAMVASAQLVYTLGAGLAPGRAGYYAGVTFITAGLPAVVGKMLLTDSVLLVCCCGAFVLLWRMATAGVTGPRSAGFWACVGLAVLAKGPAVVLFVGALGLGLLSVPGRRRWLVSRRFWLAISVAFAIAVPWFVLISFRAGGDFAGQFLVFEVVDRLRGTPHGHGGPPGYLMALSLVLLMPWTPFVPGTLLIAWARRRCDLDARVLLIWLAVPWILLELIPSKLPHYVLPCFVPISLLLGKAWSDAFDQRRSASAHRAGERVVLGLWIAIPILIGVTIVGGAVALPGAALVPAVVLGASLVVGFTLVGRWQRRGAGQRAWHAAVVVMIVFHAILGFWLLPSLEPDRLSRNVARAVNNLAVPGDAVLASGFDEPSLFFYVHLSGRAVTTDAIVDALREGDAPVVAVVDGDSFEALPLELREAVDWQRIDGVNYVHMKRTTVRIGRLAGQGSR